MRRYQSCSMTTGSSNHYHISTIPTDGKMMFGMILIASFVLKRSEAFIDSTRADGPSISYSSCATASSTFNSPDESAFWGRERTQEEICQFVTDAVLSVESKLETPRVEVLSAEPPLIVVHNFVSPSDCHAIITATQQHQEMKRSTMGASQETSQERTSSTAWLPESLCEQPLGRLSEKASRISQLPTSYMENLQVVKYQPGQEFQIHTDHLDSFNDLECRGRLATCLVYLESPDEAGETSFPEFSVEIPPTQGSAVFFWNTIERPGMENYDPHMFLHVDTRLRHAGLPVVKGTKWIANKWLHPIDYGAGVRGTSTKRTATV
jgi:prolyl 4-hydroxylase